MNCKVTEEHLNLFLDGELEPTDSERVSAHLRDCDRCSDYLESIARVRDVLRGLPRARAADGFSETVGKRISAARTDTDSTRRGPEAVIYPGTLRRFTQVLAAACVLFVAFTDEEVGVLDVGVERIGVLLDHLVVVGWVRGLRLAEPGFAEVLLWVCHGPNLPLAAAR